MLKMKKVKWLLGLMLALPSFSFALSYVGYEQLNVDQDYSQGDYAGKYAISLYAPDPQNNELEIHGLKAANPEYIYDASAAFNSTATNNDSYIEYYLNYVPTTPKVSSLISYSKAISDQNFIDLKNGGNCTTLAADPNMLRCDIFYTGSSKTAPPQTAPGDQYDLPILVYNGLRARTVDELTAEFSGAQTGTFKDGVSVNPVNHFEISAQPSDFSNGSSVSIVNLSDYISDPSKAQHTFTFDASNFCDQYAVHEPDIAGNCSNPGRYLYTPNSTSMPQAAPLVGGGSSMALTNPPTTLAGSQTACAASNPATFTISGSTLSAQNLCAGIYQINVKATGGNSESAYFTFYVNVNNANPSLAQWSKGYVSATTNLFAAPWRTIPFIPVYTYRSQDPITAPTQMEKMLASFDEDLNYINNNIFNAYTVGGQHPKFTVALDEQDLQVAGDQVSWSQAGPTYFNPFGTTASIRPVLSLLKTGASLQLPQNVHALASCGSSSCHVVVSWDEPAGDALVVESLDSIGNVLSQATLRAPSQVGNSGSADVTAATSGTTTIVLIPSKAGSIDINSAFTVGSTAMASTQDPRTWILYGGVNIDTMDPGVSQFTLQDWATAAAQFPKSGVGYTMNFGYGHAAKTQINALNELETNYTAQLMQQIAVVGKLSGLTFDPESGIGSPTQVQLYKAACDRLAYNGKWCGLYEFADKFSDSVLPALGPMGMPFYSEYDAGDYRAADTSANAAAAGLNLTSYTTQGWSVGDTAILYNLFNSDTVGCSTAYLTGVAKPVSYCALSAQDQLANNVNKYLGSYFTIYPSNPTAGASGKGRNEQELDRYYNQKFTVIFTLGAGATSRRFLEIWNPDFSDTDGTAPPNVLRDLTPGVGGGNCVGLDHNWMLANANVTSVSQLSPTSKTQLDNCLEANKTLSGGAAIQTYRACGTKYNMTTGAAAGQYTLAECIQISGLPSSIPTATTGANPILNADTTTPLAAADSYGNQLYLNAFTQSTGFSPYPYDNLFVGFGIFALETEDNDTNGFANPAAPDDPDVAGHAYQHAEPWYIGGPALTGDVNQYTGDPDPQYPCAHYDPYYGSLPGSQCGPTDLTGLNPDAKLEINALWSAMGAAEAKIFTASDSKN